MPTARPVAHRKQPSSHNHPQQLLPSHHTPTSLNHPSRITKSQSKLAEYSFCKSADSAIISPQSKQKRISEYCWMRSAKRQPSDHLLSLLRAEGLAAQCDLDRCLPLVRKLASELPDFDSVWLDAMVRLRQLTPWQASQLQQTPPGALSVGPFLLCDQLGEHSLLAIDRRSGRRCVLADISTAAKPASSGLRKSTQELLERLQTLQPRPPATCSLPTELAEDCHGRLWLASPHAGNWSFDDLVIRGGRLPWQAVAEIGRELLLCLAWFEQSGLTHGNLTTSSVRLCHNGQIVLTAAFARRLRRPGFSIGQQLTLRDCEGFAPELSESTRQPDRRSELYALGCLLWQLLAGRPVVISADPVRRLISQREHDITDIRILVPECPESLARGIQMMTRRLPELRPDSATELLRLWTPRPHGSSALRQIVRALPESRTTLQLPASAALPQSFPARLMRRAAWPAAAFAALAGLGIAASRSDTSLIPLTASGWRELLAPAPSTVPENASTSPPEIVAGDIVHDMPQPDADGIIRLQPGHTYRTRDLRVPGRLTIECTGPASAAVQVPANGQWILAAATVELRGLQLHRDSGQPTPATPRQLAAVQCQSLLLQNCHVQSPATSDDCTGLAWFRPAAQPGIIELQNCVFAGGGYGISCNHPPRRLQLDNVLLACRGGGLLLEFGQTDSADWQATLKNVTQRFGFSLLDAVVHPDGPQNLALRIASQDCVYQPRMAVARIRPPENWKPANMQIRFHTDSGHPAIVNPTAESAVYIDRSLNQTVALPTASLPDNMLLFVDSTFADAEQQSFRTPWEASLLLDFDGPKLSQQLPGIIAAQLPANPAADYFTN
jgi:hypothetical protein